MDTPNGSEPLGRLADSQQTATLTTPKEPSTVGDLIAQAQKHPLKWIVPDVVLEDGLHVLHGTEESFKTMLTLQLLEVLALGGQFLLRNVQGELKAGIAELEMKNRQFSHRLARFFPNSPPDIKVLSDSLRRRVLAGRTGKQRIEIIVDWADTEGLQFVAIDSVVKLFPPGFDLNKPDVASEVFNQLQRLPTAWILAHDRKALFGQSTQSGNAEIVGSGRFAQDPDVIHQMIRSDRRAPRVEFHWGKMRDGEKSDPIPLYFDRVDYRLYPLHPYLHLLLKQPMLGTQLVAETEKRYGWKERRARDYLTALDKLVDANGNSCVTETMQGHSSLYTLSAAPVALLESP